MTPEITDLSIVLIGDFSPSIIQPYWLAYKKLITESDAQNARIEMVHKEITKFDLDWANLEITRQRFLIRTLKQDYFEITKDLVVSIFKILKDTPLSYLGINHVFHFKFDPHNFEKISNSLVSFNIWRNIIDDPKLLSLQITENPRKDGLNGSFNVIINPSELIQYDGISININDHFGITTDNKNTNNKDIVNILTGNWANSLDRANKLYTNLWKNLAI
ncbi:MAG: hypothetical protein NW226_26300 [Microscillaceae bacterium]|nr:hypothetical protein [Microscillaceae bacterium]